MREKHLGFERLLPEKQSRMHPVAANAADIGIKRIKKPRIVERPSDKLKALCNAKVDRIVVYA